MGLKETFEKQGGMGLIRQYVQSGALGTAVGEFLLLGKSRTALEILRLSTQLKARQQLERRYRQALEDFERRFDESLPHEASDRVWVCWLQGIENAPELVRRCYASLAENLTDRRITLITAGNMADYVQFPEAILEKWRSVVISNTHLTDLLRLELLIRYGGMWLDATVFCSAPRAEIPDYFFDSELFLYQCLKPGRDGHSLTVSSWLMSARTNSRILMAARHLCYAYWEKNDRQMDYFLLHMFLSLALERYSREAARIVPRDNAAPHILLLRLFAPFDAGMWSAIRAQTPFHKLSYKFASDQAALPGTFYQALFGKQGETVS